MVQPNLDRRRFLAGTGVVALTLGGAGSALSNRADGAPATASTRRPYASDDTVFANPERGFYHRVDITNLTDDEISFAHKQHITLLHSYVRLDDYRARPIARNLLHKLDAGLAKARTAGLKALLRVAYNFGPYPDSEPDASRKWIHVHLQQLKPVFAANADVIAAFEAGFIGAWGEWHTSTHGYDTDMNAKKEIFQEILRAYPANRQVALRYPSDIRALLPQLSPSEARRLSSHQDCFGASPTDSGTWGRDGVHTAAEDKALIAGLRGIVGGETCEPNSARAHCDTALAELSMMHFSYLNIDYHPGVLQHYRDEGCFDTLSRNFGYRFRLVNSDLPSSARSGGELPIEVVLHNDGWASPYNRRPVFVVLDGPAGTFPIGLPDDPRTWEAGGHGLIRRTVTLPRDLPPDTYRLALWLPDQAERLRSDAAYSIRFANKDVWDANKGVNVLGALRVIP